MPDQGQSERPSAKEGAPRLEPGNEIKFSYFYNQEKTPKIIFGRAPTKYTDERFKAKKGQKTSMLIFPKIKKILAAK